ncbi:cation:proton antiporter [Microbacterium sp.]|uniref:cation:proton antiporter n=1 Tax=Microbacterium sp. TaxID=51671 RepID=UPI003A8912EE
MMSAEGAGTTAAIVSMFWILLAVFLAPIVARMLRGYVPDVVLLLAFGVLIGGHGVGLADTAGGVDLVSELGLGLLFLLAGYEIDPRTLGGRQGGFAWGTWLFCLALATGAGLLLVPDFGFTAAVALGIALSSTALGTLLPILKQLGIQESSLGRAVLIHGAVGELGPVLAMAVLLSTHSPWASLVLLVVFGLAVLVIWLVPQRLVARDPRLFRFIHSSADGTGQLMMRATMLMLMALMAVAAVFDLDVVLGAFAAGAVLRQIGDGLDKALAHKLDAVGYGFLIPVFFVVSGMGIDIGAVVTSPLTWLGAVAAIWVFRGVPVWASERVFDTGSGLMPGQRRQLALFAATGLPIIVAVTGVAVSNDLMPRQLASSLVAAGATTVLLFPLLAQLAGMRNARLTDSLAA